MSTEKKYYIVSLTHTSKGDTALTFWGHNGSGYTWNRDMAGLYDEEEMKKHISPNNVAVPKEKVDPYWMNATDFSDKYIAVPNNAGVLYNFDILEQSKIYMKPKKHAGCRMTFLNTPLETIKL
jgi:hypothetical protein